MKRKEVTIVVETQAYDPAWYQKDTIKVTVDATVDTNSAVKGIAAYLQAQGDGEGGPVWVYAHAEKVRTYEW